MIPVLKPITVEIRPMNHRLWELVAKELDGSISLEERVELEGVCREIEGDASSSGGRSGALRAEPVALSQAKPAAAIANGSELWPTFEFRPFAMPGYEMLRYADGQWIADDGEYDTAFVVPDKCLALYVDLPFQRNIIWSGLTTHWRGYEPCHPRGGNPWHYMLRDGETDWGGGWPGRDRHPNKVAGRKAMDHCCSLRRCANGTGPKFEIGDRYIAAGLVRERDTKRVVTFPKQPVCMFCGEAWAVALDALAAATGTARTAKPVECEASQSGGSASERNAHPSPQPSRDSSNE